MEEVLVHIVDDECIINQRELEKPVCAKLKRRASVAGGWHSLVFQATIIST